MAMDSTRLLRYALFGEFEYQGEVPLTAKLDVEVDNRLALARLRHRDLCRRHVRCDVGDSSN